MATLLSKGNGFRKSIKEKKIVLNDLEKEVENLKKKKRKLMCKEFKIDELGCIARFYLKRTVLISKTLLKHFLRSVICVNSLPSVRIYGFVNILVANFCCHLSWKIIRNSWKSPENFFFKFHWLPCNSIVTFQSEGTTYGNTSVRTECKFNRHMLHGRD